jgi:uncharacterized repeat protein (TIGR03803 family)
VSETPWFAAAVIATISLSATAAQAAWTETVLTRFGAGSLGSYDGLIFDGKGNLYGTNVASGTKGYGSVFKLTPPKLGTGAWAKTDIHIFGGPEGARPNARVISDTAGNLYGTTRDGGASGFGTVFRPAQPAAGKTAWTLTVLHSFTGADGRYPVSALLFGLDGNLYGTTEYGGPNDLGTAFKLTKPAATTGVWAHTVLHAFSQSEGGEIVGGLAFDNAGNLYGTASAGGQHQLGTVFKLAHPAAGKTAWTESALHHFAQCACDGANPEAALSFDSAGNLYGTTNGGGANGAGTVFRLAPPVKGTPGWSLSVLYSFSFASGIYPDGGLTSDASGNLYGTTSEGGSAKNGTVFKLNRPAAGTSHWSETTLHIFGATDGAASYSNVIFDKAGSLYGTTSAGGEPASEGVVFKLTP